MHGIGDMLAGCVVIGRVDVEIGRSTDAARQIRENRRGAVARPVAIPDVVDGRAARDQRAAVIVDAIAAACLTARLALTLRLSLPLSRALSRSRTRRRPL